MRISDALGSVRRLFLDTAPVIYHVEGVSAYQPLTDIVFQWVSSTTGEAVTSPVTLAECLVHPFQKQDMAMVDAFRQVITAASHTRYASLDGTAERAAELRARYNLTPTDAFQLAAAIGTACDAFLTNDVRLKRVQELAILVLDELTP